MINQICYQALELKAADLKQLTNIRNAIAHAQEDIKGMPADDKKIYYNTSVLATITSVRSLFLRVQGFMETTPNGWNPEVWNALWSNWESSLPDGTVLQARDRQDLARIRTSLRKTTNWTIGLGVPARPGTAVSPRQLVISGSHIFEGLADAFETRLRLQDLRVRQQLARIMRNELKVRVFSRLAVDTASAWQDVDYADLLQAERDVLGVGKKWKAYVITSL